MKKTFFLPAAIFFIAGVAFLVLAPSAWAAPDIITRNLTGMGAFQPGQTITFSGEVVNQGDGMDLSNSYGFAEKAQYVTPDGDWGYFPIAISGDYAYVGSSTIGDDLEVFDISNPLSPTKVSGLNLITYNKIEKIVIVGNYAYLGTTGLTTNTKFMVVDIANPARPAVVGYVPIPDLNNIHDISISGNYAFLAGSDRGKEFYVIDISNPRSPTKKIELDIPRLTGLNGVTVSGNYAYTVGRDNNVCDGINPPEFRIFNISNPLSPLEIGTLELYASRGDCKSGGYLGSMLSVAVAGDYAYLGGDSALIVVNISNPANPVETLRITTDRIWTVNILNGYLHAATEFGGVNVYDISNPANPVAVSNIGNLDSLDENANANRYTEVAFSDNRAFVTQWQSSSTGNAHFEVFELVNYTRFCMDNPNCSTSTTGRIGEADFDTGILAAGAFEPFSATWIATAGNHTVYFCSDVVRDTGEYYGNDYDGVAESNEANNCSSATFSVLSGPTVSFSANPEYINQGETSNLVWSATNAAYCWGWSHDGLWDGWKSNTGGSDIVTPALSTEYSIECWNGTGTSSGIKMATVTVDSLPVNGTCGDENELTLCLAPTLLCRSGNPSSVSGTGIPDWTWTCSPEDSYGGGTTANCWARQENCDDSSERCEGEYINGCGQTCTGTISNDTCGAWGPCDCRLSKQERLCPCPTPARTETQDCIPENCPPSYREGTPW
jgi:hypothetical protein